MIFFYLKDNIPVQLFNIFSDLKLKVYSIKNWAFIGNIKDDEEIARV